MIEALRKKKHEDQITALEAAAAEAAEAATAAAEAAAAEHAEELAKLRTEIAFGKEVATTFTLLAQPPISS